MINIFKRKRKPKKDIFEQGNFNIGEIDVLRKSEFMVSLVYANNMVNTIYPACASCYGISEDKNSEYKQKVDYIGRRVKTRHTSILEHSNIVIQVFIPLKNEKNDDLSETVRKYNKHIKPELSDISESGQDILSMIMEITDECRYLTTHSDIICKDSDPILRITFGGSVRGYRYIFENIKNRQNNLFISIFNVLKLVVPSSLFIDFINDGVMEDYTTIEITKDLVENIPQRLLNNITSDDLDIINMDNLENVSELAKLPREDCFDFVSITVDFKNMSRIITQQLTRHRNGITQESQRYVNYGKASFNSPAKFKDKYDPEKLYDTPIGDFNLEDLGGIIASLYEYLVDQGLDKEDARAYLPQNIQCGKVFMTFNLRTLFVFLNLRLDEHAQAEIRSYAERLSDMTDMYGKDLGIDDMYLASAFYSEPLYKRIENNDLYNDINEEV